MPTMKRCLAQFDITVGDRVESLQPGMEVNFERELAPGVTLAAAVAGRHDCFEDVVVVANVTKKPTSAFVPAAESKE